MRKRNISFFADTFFWYLLYLFPVLAYLFYYNADGYFSATFATFMSDNLGFVFDNTNIIYTTIQDLFGSSGVLPLWTVDSTGISLIVTWFVTVFVVHLVVDFILFIPRLCHKFMDKFYQGDN